MKLLTIPVTLLLAVNSQWSMANEREVLERFEPKYPMSALKEKVSGCARVEFFVLADGSTSYIEVVESSPIPEFGEEAIKAVSRWKYKPMNDGDPAKRMTTTLSFSMSEEEVESAQDNCAGTLSNESHDLESFRFERLNKPFKFTDEDGMNSHISRLNTVLSAEESVHFQSILNTFTDKSELNGLSYLQIIDLMTVDVKTEQETKEDTSISLSQQQIDDLPVLDAHKVFTHWNTTDMKMGMGSSLYKEISHRLLRVELLIHSSGKAKIVSTCRTISNELREELEWIVNGWQITPKVKNPKTMRAIWGVPAPGDESSYYDCDNDWFPDVRKYDRVLIRKS